MKRSTTEVLKMAEPRYRLSEGGRAGIRVLIALGDEFDIEVRRITEDEGLTPKGKARALLEAGEKLRKAVAKWQAETPDAYQRRIDIEKANIEKAQSATDQRDQTAKLAEAMSLEIRAAAVVAQMSSLGLDPLERDIATRNLPDRVAAVLEQLAIVRRTSDGFGVEPVVSPKVALEAQAARLQARIPAETRRMLAELEEEMQTLNYAANSILAEASRLVPADAPLEAQATEPERIRVIA